MGMRKRCGRRTVGMTVRKLSVVALVALLTALSVFGLHHSLPAIKHITDGHSPIHEYGQVFVSVASSLHTVTPPTLCPSVCQSPTESAPLDNQLTHTSNHPCNDELCTQHLKPADLRRFENCTRRQWTEYKNGTCRFMKGTSRRSVALESFPGSGSTWVRGLLEKATGICTGSVYCDASLRTMGFNGEGVSSPAVLAVKTHETLKSFKAAIHIVRCPAHALVAEWNRKQGTTDRGSFHTALAPPEAFGVNKEWGEFVEDWSHRWGQAALRLAKYQMMHPLLRVTYEDLQSNTSREVVRMLDFLHVPYSQSLVEKRLNDGFQKFLRPAGGQKFKHFTASQRKVLVTMLSDMISECSQKGFKDTKKYVRHYLMTCI